MCYYRKTHDLDFYYFNPFTPRVSYGDIKVILTSEPSVDEILWCDHSNETSSAVVDMVLFIFKCFTK